VEEFEDYLVRIPDGLYELRTFTAEELPCITGVNIGLADLEAKVVFGWHLSVIFNFNDIADNGMPSPTEVEDVKPWEDELDKVFIGDIGKPNALFLGRVTWNGTRELMYRVFEPEPIHQYLAGIIEAKSHPRWFGYRIDPDSEWELALWLFEKPSKRKKPWWKVW